MTQLEARTKLCACRLRFWRNATCDLIWSRTGLVSDTSAAAEAIVSGLRNILMQIGFLMKFSSKFDLNYYANVVYGAGRYGGETTPGLITNQIT